MKTTIIVYVNGSSLGNQYAPKNCTGYGTKWKVQIGEKNGNNRIVGLPKLLDSNISVNDKILCKIEKSNRKLDRILGY